MKLSILASFLGVAAAAATGGSPGLNLTTAEAGNPIFDGWFADPEIRVYDDVFWIFATTSVAFDNQKHFDAWSSTDLAHWYVGLFPHLDLADFTVQSCQMEINLRHASACFSGLDQLTV